MFADEPINSFSTHQKPKNKTSSQSHKQADRNALQSNQDPPHRQPALHRENAASLVPGGQRVNALGGRACRNRFLLILSESQIAGGGNRSSLVAKSRLSSRTGLTVFKTAAFTSPEQSRGNPSATPPGISLQTWSCPRPARPPSACLPVVDGPWMHSAWA